MHTLTEIAVDMSLNANKMSSLLLT